MTAMQDLKEDLLESVLKINNELDFLDNISDLKIRELCKLMVDVTIKNIVKRIDEELLEMEKNQTIQFAEWTHQNCWEYQCTSNLWINLNEVNRDRAYLNRKKTEELFQEFIKNEKTNDKT